MSVNMDSSPTEPQLSTSEIFEKARKRALAGGLAGSAAMAIQVTALMWMRTTMNYQYRNGASTTVALKTLYADGGVLRFYRGYAPALLQGPLSRFGDTAANVGVLEFLNAKESTRNWPVGAKTVCASIGAAFWRICLMPIDATKTSLQVHGKTGLKMLGQKVGAGGPTVLWHGAMAAYSASLVGHFPWFFTFNFLDETLPAWDDSVWTKLGRRAMQGFTASVVSDTCSNSIRVVKTVKQTSPVSITYPNAVKEVVSKDGVIGLFGRGLKTRIMVNGMQGLMFAVLWKGFQDMWAQRQESKEAAA